MKPNPNAAASGRCLCATVRRASRLLTRRYEEALRPTGITASQFELMMTLRATGPVGQGRLAQLIETDQTTLSRNLALMMNQGWVGAERGDSDGRRRTYRLTIAGLTVLDQAQGCWRGVQEQVEQSLGSLGAPMAEVWGALDRVLKAACEPAPRV